MHAPEIIERIGDMRCGVGESSMRRDGGAALCLTGTAGRALRRWDTEANRAHACALPETAGSIALIAGG
ncbi:hypothetical protein X946_931 [Burkholderia sp. ABCPW 111]|nr:hypothetical protein X946_931 [Burkholderia sp. ABCPW 111]KVK79894.1 hypothetical protein WS91_12670 [Burkholderia sp. MSMB1498]